MKKPIFKGLRQVRIALRRLRRKFTKEVNNKKAVFHKNEFYVSFKNDITPSCVTGGTIELYETKKDCKTYKVTQTEPNQIVINI